MKNSYFVYFLLIILSACNDKKSGTASLNGEIKGLGNDTIYIYGVDEMYDRMDTLLVENDKFLTYNLSRGEFYGFWMVIGFFTFSRN